MISPRSLLCALVAAVALTGVPGAATAAAPATSGQVPSAAPRTAGSATPLSVTIDTLTPTAVPRRGPITVSGTVTNEDDVPWERVFVFSFISATPITTEAGLVEAARTEEDAEVGERITTPGRYDTLDRIEPGQTLSYTFRVDRASLGVSEEGVYWFGVHALGETEQGGRIPGADGRARTFLPLVAPRRDPVDTAVVVPLRREVRLAADGSIENPRAWTNALGAGGRLRSLVDLGAAAGDRPITWLLDPALVDAAARLAAGNPPRSLAPTLTADGEESIAPSPSGTASVTPGEGESSTADPGSDPADPEDAPEDPGVPAHEPDADEVEAAEAATAWLARLREAVGSQQVLALPYGDPDLAGAARNAPEVYPEARERSAAVLESLGIASRPAVGSPSGYLDRGAIAATDPGDTALVTDRMWLREGDVAPDAPAVASVAGRRLVVTSSETATGGPGPGDRLEPIGLRQRILAEAALRALRPDPEPLVVVLPQDWVPASTTSFFGGLDADFVRLSSVGSATVGVTATATSAADLDYPATQRRRELGPASFTAARRLSEAGASLERLLTRNDQVGAVVAAQALAATSYAARVHPTLTRAAADASTAWIDALLRGVTVEVPRGVTLSAASGQFYATISNPLDQQVTVAFDARVDDGISLEVPSSVDVPARGQETVPINASTRRIGVHNVTLVLTDVDNRPLGDTASLPIRPTQVSNVIWLFLGAGIALLFGAIVVRLVRRVRRAAREARSPRAVPPPEEPRPEPRPGEPHSVGPA